MFRCSIICLLFQVNGIIDVTIATTCPIIFVIANGFKLEGNIIELKWAAPYIVVTFVAMLILNYLLAKEYKNIFMLHRDERS